MKKSLTLLIVVLISTSLFSQQRSKSFMGWHLAKDKPTKLNEVKLNLGTTIFGLFPEITYERLLSEDLSVGGSVGVNLGDEYIQNFSFTPYVRWFFGGSSQNMQKYAAGFFIELNGSVFSSEDEYEIYTEAENHYQIYKDNVVGAGLGLAAGWKYLSKNNWVGEVYIGGGRDFANDSGYPRLGLSIGKRF